MYDLGHSVFRVFSSDDSVREFGTAFAVHQDDYLTYFITCRHVVTKIPSETLRIAGAPAYVLTCGSEESPEDIAVVCTQKDPGRTVIPLRLTSYSTPSSEVEVHGYKEVRIVQDGGHAKQFHLTPRTGELLYAGQVESSDASSSVDILYLQMKEGETIHPGNSGGPVLLSSTGHVIGIVDTSKWEGKQGTAISVAALHKCWTNPPPPDGFRIHTEQDVLQTQQEATQQQRAATVHRESSLPVGHVRRDIFKSVSTIMEEDTQERFRVVYGTSGCGKTVLVTDWCKHAKAKHGLRDEQLLWIDCQLHYEKPPLLSPQTAAEEAVFSRVQVVVFDNVTMSHPFIRDRWCLPLRDKVLIVITRDKRAANEARAHLSAASDDTKFVELEPFNSDEVHRYLEARVGQFASEIVDVVSRMTKGFPVCLQLLGEIASSCPGFDLEQFLSSAATESEVLALLLREWLLECNDNRDTRDIFYVLSLIPFVGMSLRTVGTVIECGDIRRLEQAVSKLREMGLVTSRRGIQPDDDSILMAHDLVRTIEFDDVDERQLQQWQQTYSVFVNLPLEVRKASSDYTHDLLTSVDSWIMGWSQVFDLNADTDIQERIDAHRGLLKRLLSTHSTAFANAIQALPGFLRTRIQDPAKERCDLLIGLCHMVTELNPSLHVATTIWLGCRNPNRWARSAAIAATVNHWHRLGRNDKGRFELERWFDYAYEQFDNREAEWLNEDGFDLDFAAATGGLLLLGDISAALDVLASSRFQDRFPCLTLAHLVLAVNAFDTNVLAEGSSGETTHRTVSLIREACRELYKSSSVVQMTARRVADYIGEPVAEQLGLTHLPVFPPGHRTAGGDVARIALSESFRDFVVDNETEPVSHLPSLRHQLN